MVNLSKDNFNNLVRNPNDINLDQSISIKKIIKKYPYFQTARIIELIGLKKFNNISFRENCYNHIRQKFINELDK